MAKSDNKTIVRQAVAIRELVTVLQEIMDGWRHSHLPDGRVILTHGLASALESAREVLAKAQQRREVPPC